MEIKNDEQQQRFYVSINGNEAFTAYSREGNVIDFHHTYVPESMRDKGVAGKIVKAALDHSRKNNYQVIATCAFVDHFIEENPEYKELLKKEK